MAWIKLILPLIMFWNGVFVIKEPSAISFSIQIGSWKSGNETCSTQVTNVSEFDHNKVKNKSYNNDNPTFVYFCDAGTIRYFRVVGPNDRLKYDKNTLLPTIGFSEFFFDAVEQITYASDRVYLQNDLVVYGDKLYRANIHIGFDNAFGLNSKPGSDENIWSKAQEKINEYEHSDSSKYEQGHVVKSGDLYYQLIEGNSRSKPLTDRKSWRVIGNVNWIKGNDYLENQVYINEHGKLQVKD